MSEPTRTITATPATETTAQAMARVATLAKEAEERAKDDPAKADAEVLAKLRELPAEYTEALECGASNNAPVLPTKNEVIDPATGRPKTGYKFRSASGNTVERS